MDVTASLATMKRVPYWAETVPAAPERAPVSGDITCDLAIVGGGFTGLWSALEARRRRPDDRIVVIEGGRCGNAASGRNGGFAAPSISHGAGNALRRWPSEAEALVRLGRANLDAFEADLAIYGIEAEFERRGKLTIAEKPWQVEGLKAQAALYKRFGIACQPLTGAELQGWFNSPVYPAGLYEPNYALLNPSKMVAGLMTAALARSVEIHENSPVTALVSRPDGIELQTAGGTIRARQVVLATNAAPPLLRRLGRSTIPIFDYTLVTRPLSGAELEAIGWTDRYGIADSGNRFHYFRKTADNRILWGGYDANYHFGSRQDAAFLAEGESFTTIARNFARVFPGLRDMTFTHGWGGIIDTSARTTFFAGTAHDGRLAYAMGFTGQGVTASRFAAHGMLDLLEGKDTERTRLLMLRKAPFRFPPEPLRWLGIRLAQHGLAREDETGKRSLFNRTLDALGLGFDS